MFYFCIKYKYVLGLLLGYLHYQDLDVYLLNCKREYDLILSIHLEISVHTCLLGVRESNIHLLHLYLLICSLT